MGELLGMNEGVCHVGALRKGGGSKQANSRNNNRPKDQESECVGRGTMSGRPLKGLISECVNIEDGISYKPMSSIGISSSSSSAHGERIRYPGVGEIGSFIRWNN